MTVLLSPSVYLCTPAVISALWRKGASSHRNQTLIFGSLHMRAQMYITCLHQHIHTHVHLHTLTCTLAYKQKATKTNSGLHFSLQLRGIPSVNMTWGMTELEVGNAVSHTELRQTPFTQTTTCGHVSCGSLVLAADSRVTWEHERFTELSTSTPC